MSTTNPINHVMLKWARTTAGMSVEDAVQKMDRKKVTADILQAWETGTESPDYAQLERLAYEVYKRPLAVFFFPKPPVEKTPRQAFRTLPASQIQRLSPRMRFLLRQAQAMQMNLEELYGGINPAERQLVRDVPFSLDAPVDELGRSVRQFLAVTLNQQVRWHSPEEAFKAWRAALETHGVFVFKDAFKEEGISGFCLHDTRSPLIYVNNSRPHTHQVFTLFHELSHLLSGTGGIDTLDEAYIQELHGRNKQIEVLCNRFASEFLVPDADFARSMARLPVNQQSVAVLAERYWVSREVILRRMRDRQLVTQQVYEQWSKEWQQELHGRAGSGGDYYLTKGAYLGDHYLELVFSRLYHNRITVEQLAEYLGIKTKSVPGMEALLFQRGATA